MNKLGDYHRSYFGFISYDLSFLNILRGFRLFNAIENRGNCLLFLTSSVFNYNNNNKTSKSLLHKFILDEHLKHTTTTKTTKL